MLDHLYPDNTETTGNYLRLVLGHITRHKLPYNPIVYTVWYEYASGRKPELNKEIESFEKTGKPISFEIILGWFRTYIADHQTTLAEKKTREFRSILTEISRHIGDSGDRLSRQESRLEDYTGQLTPSTSNVEVKNLSAGILSETRSIIKENHSLKQDMDETITEIDALKKELEGMKQAAKTDMLTGLLNRRGFDDAMAGVLQHAADEVDAPLSVIMTDIDHFKRVNDTHGHLIGDNVLKMLSKLLKDHIKGKDIAARFGGEEFILVLPDTPLDGGRTLAEQIRGSLQNMKWRTKNSGKSIGPITISLGVAQYRPGEEINTLIKRADDALYFAKENGRNKTITEQDL